MPELPNGSEPERHCGSNSAEPGLLDPEYSRLVCPKCGGAAAKDQEFCLTCLIPLKTETERAEITPRKHALPKPINYGLFFHGFMGGLGIFFFILVVWSLFRSSH